MMNIFRLAGWVPVLLLVLGATGVHAGPLSGNVVGKHIFGLARDYQGDPVMRADRPLIYSEVKAVLPMKHGDRAFRISVFSDGIGALYLTLLDDNGEAFDTHAVNLADAGGLTQPGTASMTPWQSALVSEVEPVDARRADGFRDSYKPYYKNKGEMVNPYNYGWPAELVVLDDEGSAKLIRDYALGRLFPDQVLIMPDQKTVYMTTRESPGQLLVFVADRSGSLSEGALYSVSRQGGRITYEEIGHGSALKLRLRIRRMKWSSLFEAAEPDGKRCPARFRFVETLHGAECLKMTRLGKRYGAYFEIGRYLAYRKLQPFAERIERLKFRRSDNSLVITTGADRNERLPLAPNADLKSKFMIRGER